MERWAKIREFPDYMISDRGRVRNEEADRLMALQVNQAGIVNVGLTKHMRQYKRAVGKLVAQEFLPPPPRASFDSVINLDGDRTNNRAENLAWRPKWFAIRYFRQFYSGHRGFVVPVYEVHTGEVFDTSWDAAVKYGLIDQDILQASINNTYVWPTNQMFKPYHP